MKLFSYGKDGGAESTVWGFWLVEIKSLFSIVLLRFENGSRDAFHSHAFNSVSWVLKGYLYEQFFDGGDANHFASLRPILTKRTNMHKVQSVGRTWVLSFRGPWAPYWFEFVNGSLIRLTHGRRIA